MEYIANPVDVVVIGGGHAGVEAALASARLGMSTILFSMSLDFIANLPCNPSIGGTAKGHLVREIDALGGEMGKAADASLLQSKMLNRGKGPAVHSLRSQADRSEYHRYMKKVLENQENLQIKQGEIVQLRLGQNKEITGVVTQLATVYPCKAVIMCSGTFLRGEIFIGDTVYPSGPDGLHAATKLSENLEELGVKLRRFKTGTPARVHSDSIDFSVLEEEPGEDPVIPFSFETKNPRENTVSCYIAFTNPETHKIIGDNIHRSAMYSGNIKGTGARYCPSVEDKIVRFPNKERHQLFIEPMGADTKELYIQGLSTSFPVDLQLEIYRSVKGFERAELMRAAYAIEYDCLDSLDLKPTLELKTIHGFFSAGQVNGTSGYEEAAAQGLVAGINAVHEIQGKEPLVLKRSSSYIGTLIDDLVTKGTDEPYRMMTSRSEYRLLLRQDNADIRLTPLGYQLGLISQERMEMFHVKQRMVKEEEERIESIVIPLSEELNKLLIEKGTSPVTGGTHFVDLLKRPQITYEDLALFDSDRPTLSYDIIEQVEINRKYAGYIEKQLKQVDRTSKLEETPLSIDLDYQDIQGLRIEAREKLEHIRPQTVGQATRISGVSPADISVLLVYLEQQRRGKK